jgi:hypothetical protein
MEAVNDHWWECDCDECQPGIPAPSGAGRTVPAEPLRRWHRPKAWLETLNPGWMKRPRSMKRLVCRNGHDLTRENTMVERNGRRRCLICRREKVRGYVEAWRIRQAIRETAA